MYEVKVIDQFSSAHKLRDYEGKCENLHGHNWKVKVCVSKDKLNKAGMVIDFKEVKRALGSVLKELDHSYLNDISYFKVVNPTSENIAHFIFNKLKASGLSPRAVSVWESDTSSATYSE